MSVQIKLVHEVTCILHSLLAALLLVCLVIELNRTISLVSNLEEINTSVTLHSMSRESTLLSTCNSTRESWLASASSCDEYRSSESNLVLLDRKSTRLNSSHGRESRMPSSA